MTSLNAERLDLNRVAIFLQVAEAHGISAAASRAKLPKSSVSRALSQLEDELGVELVVRRTRQFQLTDAGQDFYDAAAKGIAAVSDARERLRRDTAVPSGKLRVAAPPGFAHAVVMPVVAYFVNAYPDVEIEVCVTATPVEPVKDGFDVVLSIGPLDDSSARVRKLGATDEGIYASPSYLETHGTPKRPSDLAKYDCILQSRMRKRTQWTLHGPSGKVDVAVKGRITVDEWLTGIAAANRDAGLVLLPTHLVGAEPSARGLVRVLPDWALKGESTQIVYAGTRHTPRRVSMFIDTLIDHMTGSCPKASSL